MPIASNGNLKTQVQDEIRHYILATGLKQGDPLPTELMLAERLGISRSVIREALNGLELIGMVETRHGVGRFVGKSDVGSMVKNLMYTVQSNVTTFRNLIEIRITLETAFLLRDLHLFNESDFNQYRENLAAQNGMIKNQCNEEDLIVSHAGFHSMLFKHSGNTLLVDLIDMFSQVQTQLYREHKYVTQDRKQYFTIHSRLLDAIETKNYDKVRSALLEHFQEPLEYIRSSGITVEIPLSNLTLGI